MGRMFAWIIGVMVAIVVPAMMFDPETQIGWVMLAWGSLLAFCIWRFVRFRKSGLDGHAVLGEEALEIHVPSLLERRIPWTSVAAFEYQVGEAVTLRIDLVDGSHVSLVCLPAFGPTAPLSDFCQALEAHVKTLDLPGRTPIQRKIGFFGSKAWYWVCMGTSIASLLVALWAFGSDLEGAWKVVVYMGFLVATFWGLYSGTTSKKKETGGV